MDERDLLIIKYLSEFKNITKTANALFISQPALTTRIKQIEKGLHTKLIHSSNKGIYLTDTGLEMVAFADKTIRQFDQLREKIQEIDNKNSVILKLAAPNIISQYYLPTLISDFKKLYPATRFEIQMVASSTVVSLIKEKKCDFGFLRNDFGWEEDDKLLLCTNYIAAVAMKKFALKDLANMSRVAYSTDSYYMKMLDLWWNNNFTTPPQIDVLVNSLDLCREMVYNGLGFGLLPSVFLPESPKAHHIIINDNQGKPIERKTYLIYRKENMDNQLTGKFLKFIKEHDFSSYLRLKKH
ncbi:MAG: LysR family transcriptional regulator [Acidaminococcaceae bacterium]|nr:LysR family transcriptional regulator [Acidaminococcaceae bacterium]